MKHVIIIAEAGVNHNGDMELAKKLVDAAAEAGADYVKFQTFKTELLVSPGAKKAEYQVKNTGENDSQFAMLKKLELGEEAHEMLAASCAKKKIRFLSTAFDHESVELLKKFDPDFFKIPSGEITNLPYLEMIAAAGKKVILSTGMSTMDEIGEALDVLRKGGVRIDDITVLHCNTEYPTPMEDVNLNAMISIREKFGVAAGYSDHTEGIEVPVAAVALGATIIEKHLTLDKTLPGPDHKASLDPAEFSAMVKAIRNIEKAMGDGVKKPSPSEMKNISVARKSIVAARDIEAGEIFTSENLAVRRPGDGLSPMKWKSVIGKKAGRKFLKNEKIAL
ncbi:MAG TPA: N-acetylneuraminate synthase [Bacteroidia bacterium]|nr:N-acetylneuraminate synthase [Bacteroidia bacterium]